ILLPIEGAEAGMEPIAARIVETPVNVEDTELRRNPRSGFIAYVPPGSVKKGEALVTTGGGKTTACTACHGTDLKGLGPVPTIAGRSPSYVTRQLYDMQHGNRAGIWTPLMAPVVSKLTQDDMFNAAAYLASLQPSYPKSSIPAAGRRIPLSSWYAEPSVQQRIARPVAAVVISVENFGDLRMPERLAGVVRQQVLL